MRSTFVLATLLSLAAAAMFGSERKVVRPAGAEPSASWSHGIVVGDTLYVSGMGGEDKSGKIPQGFNDEVKQALENIGAVLKAADMTADNVVSVQVYLTDVSRFEAMNAVYKSFFKDPRPTRTTVVVAKLVGSGRIEITTTARK